MKFWPFFITTLILPQTALAGEWSFDVSGHAQGLYGYTDVSKQFEHKDKNNHGVGQGDVNFVAAYNHDDDYNLSLHLDLMDKVYQMI